MVVHFFFFLHISPEMEESISSDLDAITITNPNEDHHESPIIRLQFICGNP